MAANLSMYAPVEQAILADYFRLPLPNELADLDLWEVDPRFPSAIRLEPDLWEGRNEDKAVANALARIALGRVQTMLPQFAVCYPNKIDLARKISTPPSRPVEMMSRHLFTIDWAMTAPCISWPEAYYLTWLPGVDRWLVTASRDSPEVGGYCDNALGHFEAGPDPINGAGLAIGGYWSDLMLDYDQQPWDCFLEAGLIDQATAQEWAREIWQAPVTEDDDDDLEAEVGL